MTPLRRKMRENMQIRRLFTARLGQRATFSRLRGSIQVSLALNPLPRRCENGCEGTEMREVHTNLIVGGMEACSDGSRGRAVVHACKHPCHQQGVGYTGNLPSSDPEYLVATRGNHLFLNMVDMDQKLQHRFTGPILSASLDFIATQVAIRTVIVHCNHGRSRSPTIAMLYLAKRADVLPSTRFDETAQAFSQLYPAYLGRRDGYKRTG